MSPRKIARSKQSPKNACALLCVASGMHVVSGIRERVAMLRVQGLGIMVSGEGKGVKETHGAHLLEVMIGLRV